jgi:hypothetical protein
MNVLTNKKPVIELDGFNGLYARGAYESCPADHLTDCMNCTFPGPKQVTIREPITVSSTIAGRSIISYFVAQTAAGPRLLTLNLTGNFYDESIGPTLLGNFAGADDFVAINLFGRTYISFKAKGKALTGTVIYYYDGTTFIPAAGAAPLTGPTLAQVSAGNVGPGTYKVAISFQSPTGYLTPPSPLASITTVGSNDIELSAIPTVPNTVPNYLAWKRVILVTQANQLTLFFVPGGTINDNTTTTATINFYDSSLIDSADYLNDILTSLPACSALKFYAGRLVLVGQLTYPDNLLLSNVSDPETFDGVLNVISFPVDYGDNTCSTALVILSVLYVMKPNGTYNTQDNGGTPSTWYVGIIDSALGAWDNGISIFASNASAQDVYDSAFVVTQRGIMLFQSGTYTPIAFSRKIESVWGMLSNVLYVGAFFYKIQIAHDVWSKRIYVAVPLSPPLQAGGSFFPAAYQYPLQTILMMDYQEGLSPDVVKWSIWTSGLFGLQGIYKMSFENFTLSYALGSTPVYQLTFCLGGTTVYKIVLPVTKKPQGYTTKYLPDTGPGTSAPINQYIITAPLKPVGGGTYTWLMLNLNIYGYGALALALFNNQRLNTPVQPTTITANIPAGSQTVTPASIVGITTSSVLLISNADGTSAEEVIPSVVTGTTFTAVFMFAKTGPGILVTNVTVTPVALRPFGLNFYTAADLQRLINFVAEGVQVLLQCDQTVPSGSNGFFQVMAIDIYGNKTWNMRPALTEAL